MHQGELHVCVFVCVTLFTQHHTFAYRLMLCTLRHSSRLMRRRSRRPRASESFNWQLPALHGSHRPGLKSSIVERFKPHAGKVNGANPRPVKLMSLVLMVDDEITALSFEVQTPLGHASYQTIQHHVGSKLEHRILTLLSASSFCCRSSQTALTVYVAFTLGELREQL